VTIERDQAEVVARARHLDRRLTASVLITGLSQASSAGTVRDTIAAVFRQRAYDRSIQETLWDRFWATLFDLLGRVLGVLRHAPAARPVVIGILVVLVVLVVARTVVAIASGAAFARRGTAPGVFGRRTDPWVEAQRLAADGRYTDAAHALYAALLEGVARREDLRLDPSKTVGDYLRDLRRRSSALMPTFRDFARLYEVVVYGLGFCDRERYERLYVLASGMLAPPT